MEILQDLIIDKCMAHLQDRKIYAGVAKPGQRRRSFSFSNEREKVRSLERKGKENVMRFLEPCSLGIRGFESHPPHHI
jgi:hypothetical protein